MPQLAVRAHGFVGAALLALAAPLAIASALHARYVTPDLYVLALLGGLTLVAQAIAFWYLPSFAKREVALQGIAANTGPVFFPAALVGAALGSLTLRLAAIALGLASFGVVLLTSAIAGKPWRSGIPFWRSAGEHQAGDITAMLALACSALWMLAAAILGVISPPLVAIAWPVALATFALGALAHYVPRNRARPLPVLAFAVAFGAFQAGAVLLVGARSTVAYALLLGLPAAGLAMGAPVGTKRAGARWRDAAPLLASAVPASAFAIALVLAAPARAFEAYDAWLAAIALAMAGLAILVLPVVFNAVPDARFVRPATIAALLGLGALAIAPVAAAALLAIALLLWLAAMAPLRAPRRDCAP